MKKIIDVVKNIFAIGFLAIIIYLFIERKTREKFNNNSNDANYFDSLLDNGGGNNHSVSDTVRRIDDNNKSLGNELEGSRADNTEFDSNIAELNKQGGQNRENITRLGRVRGNLERLLDRIRNEGVTED